MLNWMESNWMNWMDELDGRMDGWMEAIEMGFRDVVFLDFRWQEKALGDCLYPVSAHI